MNPTRDKMMIDWHSHILPCIDDGSSSVKESMLLLQSLKQQGVDTVIATPHFYANKNSIDEFLSRRQHALDKLLSECDTTVPDIVCGAEVRYYLGISQLSDLKKLCIENTNLLLLEMPFESWSESVIRELLTIGNSRGIDIILAHVDRYVSYVSNNIWNILKGNEILMQLNATSINRLFTRNRAMQFLKKNQVQFIGSDCHNMKSRPPEISKAFEIIEKKLGTEYLNSLSILGESYIKN